jgi:DNA-binding XRE family transcriptional regulator
MRKHHTETTSHLEISREELDRPMSIEEFIRDSFGDLPQWAVMLRGLRNREGLTQAAIGNLLGIPQGNISQMERGKRPIGKQLAKKLAELFHTDYRLFL